VNAQNGSHRNSVPRCFSAWHALQSVATFPASSLRSGAAAIVSTWPPCRCRNPACLRCRNSSRIAAVCGGATLCSRARRTRSSCQLQALQRQRSRMRQRRRTRPHAAPYPRSVLVPRGSVCGVCLSQRGFAESAGQPGSRHGFNGASGIASLSISSSLIPELDLREVNERGFTPRDISSGFKIVVGLCRTNVFAAHQLVTPGHYSGPLISDQTIS
jgi:hypothetical protein